MPELPEVQTVVDTLKNLIQAKRISNVEVLWDNTIANVPSAIFSKQLIGQSFHSFLRRGKYLVFQLDDYVLITHLRMEGKFYYHQERTIPDKHTHVLIHFEDGSSIHYHDVRKFGKMYLYASDEEQVVLSNLGKEPWDKELTCAYLKKKIGNKKITVKQFLLDQSIITGIGNIYANEILFLAGIHPTKKVDTLSEKNLKDIIQYTQNVLELAIQKGGTTVRSYTSSLGVTGKFQLSLLVYQREGQMCKHCHSIIEKLVQNGRSSFYCPKCQKVEA